VTTTAETIRPTTTAAPMTDVGQAPSPAPETGRAHKRAARRGPGWLPVAGGSTATFLALFGFMAVQLRAGHDPALGGATTAAAQPAKKVVVKQIRKRVVETRVIEDAPASAGGGSAPVSAPAAAPAAPAAPAAAPAPAPAPPPAPVSRAS
jgi:hypothetical protein